MVKTLPYKISGLSYVYVVVPVAKADDGTEYIDLPMNMVERAVAVGLIQARVPIRGAEVRFLRSALGLSLKKWGSYFSLSAAGVQKWEKARGKRLAPVNEAAVRAFCAEQLGVPLDGRWSELIAKDKAPKRLALRVNSAA